MGVYTDWVDGYLTETTYGTSLIANTNTQTYSLGILSENAIHPSPRSSIIYGGTGAQSFEVPDGKAWKSVEDLRGAYTIVMQNGLLFYYVLGDSSTVGDVHTVVPATDGTTELPSFTIQHDLTGTATDWGTQYKGCKIAQAEFNCNFKDQVLYCNVDWIAKSAANAGFISTNAPTLPATATEGPYVFNNMTFTFDGNDYRPNLQELRLTINPDLTVWRDGTRNLKKLIEASRKKYLLQVRHSPPDSVMWDEAAATGNTKNIVIKWTKSTNDYIQATLTNCHFGHHEQITPTTKTELIEEVIIEPEAVSVDVKDTLADSEYGD